MKYLKILQYPNPILRYTSQDIKDIEESRDIVKKLKHSLKMSKKEGIGLSAPQIGISKRVFIAKKIMHGGDKEINKDVAFINPQIIKKSHEKVNSLEGCLSIKNTYGYVVRHKKIKISYLNEYGESKILKVGGYLSLVIQHEHDHLEGILFIDKLINNKSYTEREIDKIIANQ